MNNEFVATEIKYSMVFEETIEGIKSTPFDWSSPPSAQEMESPQKPPIIDEEIEMEQLPEQAGPTLGTRDEEAREGSEESSEEEEDLKGED